ncbi:MAG: agmatine deiminase family protein [Ignavibacteria bacterium]|jgi:agmatine/peptidylarginine deiminase|nr:agmatine deiminase family protein [Ignavibacteria bacterium]
MKKTLSIVLAVAFLTFGANAEQMYNTNTFRPIPKDRVASMNHKDVTHSLSDFKQFKSSGKVVIPQEQADAIRKEIAQHLLQNKMARQPNQTLSPNIKVKAIEASNSQKPQNHLSASPMTTLPKNLRMVGEFEEVQAVIVALPSVMAVNLEGDYYPIIFDYDFNGLMDVYGQYYGYTRTVDIQIPPGCGVFWPWYFEMSDDFNDVYLIPENMVEWLPELGIYKNDDGTADITIAKIWGKLIYSIQQAGAQSWIRLSGIADSSYVMEYFAQMGYPFTPGMYKFFSNKTEDAFWARDWGPFGVYYDDANDNRKLGFVDAKYYTGRAFDDEFAKVIYNEQGYDWYDVDIKTEGGNIMSDGDKYITYDNVIYDENKVNYGQYYWSETDECWYVEPRQTVTNAQLDQRIKETFSQENIVMQSMKYDGGTGHIDLWAKQFDEESILIAYFPDKYNTLSDYKVIQQNREKYKSLKTTFGTDYRLLDCPMPRLDNKDMPTTNTDYNKDPRCYINGVTVNQTFIYPTFSTEGETNWNYDKANEATIAKALPGYKLVGIDSRYLTPGGGAIHCITMQIPKDPDKLITIKHKPVRDYQEFTTSITLTAELTSNTNADNVMMWWYKKNDQSTSTPLPMVSADGKIYTATLTGFEEKDTIRYFIAARNSETTLKTAPITAPEGYYEFWFNNTSIEQLYGYEPTTSSIASVYPNPAADHINVIFENQIAGNVSVDITNSLGQVLLTPISNKYFDSGVFNFDVNNMNLASGMYFIKLNCNGTISVSTFVVK